MTSSSDSGSDTSSRSAPPPNSLAGLSLSIFADLLGNLTHDIALQTHRAEKLLRTRQQHLHPPGPHLDASPPPTTTPNPLATVPAEILCARCHLPQHTPTTLETTTSGPKKKFCPRHPWHNTPLHDIYGNPFPTIKDKSSKASATDSPAEDAPAPGKKGSTGAVYFKCTSCDNEKVLSSRFAAHLEKCLGLAGRKSSRAAMAKMNSSSGSGSGSPMLAPVDAPSKSASRKPSPEKKSKSPVPAEETAVAPTPVPPPPPPTAKPVFAGSATAVTTTPKKKKKKAQSAAPIPPPATAEEPPPPTSAQSKIDAPPPPPPPPPATTAPVAQSQKKRKRKVDAHLAQAAAQAAAAGETPSVPGDAITVSKPPVSKKLKMSEKMEREKSALGDGAGPVMSAPKKSRIDKLKNGRGNSPSAGGGTGKAGRTSSPNPHASPPTTHKSLPPKPPPPISGNPLASPPPTASKPRKPKPGGMGGGMKKGGDGSVKKSKPKVKKSAGSSVSGVPGKTVPRIAGKTVPIPVPGVARKGVKE